MQENIKNNNNINERAMNNNIKWNGSFDCIGLCTVFHHHYFQMVDILMHYCKCTMGGLNPYLSLHVPQYQVDVNAMDEKMKEKDAKSPINKVRQGEDLTKNTKRKS